MTIIGSEEVQLLKIARKRAKATHCMLCGQRMSSPHNSHSVPQMILRSITEEGWALKTDVILDPSERTERGEGLNRIGTFFLICSDCDNKVFKSYETRENLIIPPSQEIMWEIVVKNTLFQIYESTVDMKYHKLLFNSNPQNNDARARIPVAKRDIVSFTADLDFYKTTRDGFKILFWKLLPYKTPVASQGQLPLVLDMNGNTINDNFNYQHRTHSMHLAVLPMENITVVMAFYHERDTEYEKLKNEMRTFSTKRCLQFLNYAVLEYTDNCYFSKRILDLVRKDRLINTVVRENNGLPDRGVNVHNWAELRWVQNHYKSPDYRIVTNLLDRRYAI